MVINKELIKRKTSKEVPVSLRITKELSNWLKEKNYSPTSIFLEACKELGYKEQ